MRIVQVWYQDHHSERLDPDSAAESSECLNWNIGLVVYEDQDWIRLCHEQTNITGGAEDWGVIAIRKADITQIRELVTRDKP